MKEMPLVSAKVITYNSAKYVRDTLESIKNQTYQNLELVISDDCSQDDTVAICKKWVKENSNRFKRVVVLESDHNTGISANGNRSLQACEGEWIKGIAGDDLLLPNCIATYMEFVQSHPDINIVFGRLCHFTIANGKHNILRTVPEEDKRDYYREFNESDAHGQYRMLLRDGCFIQAPTGFVKAEFRRNHPYNEIYKYEEDYPMWLNLTKQGFRMYVLFEKTVLYRVGESLSHREKDYYSRNYMSTRSLFFWNECLEYFKQENLPEAYNKYRKQLLRYELTEAFMQNKKNKFHDFIFRVINHMVNKYAHYEL